MQRRERRRPLAEDATTSEQLLRQRTPQHQARARSEQHQFYPNGQFHMLSSSPVALTPSLSPLYRPQLQHQQQQQQVQQQGAARQTAEMDERVSQLFTMHVPAFFDALEKFQYQQALQGVDDDEGAADWEGWGAFALMLKLGASCESTYHSMKFLEPDQLPSDTLEGMYDKLIVLMNHLVDELRPVVDRQSRHFPVVTKSPVYTGGSRSTASDANIASPSESDMSSEVYGEGSDPLLLLDMAMCGDMSYYVELLEQSAEFFSLRIPMIQLYRGLARSSVPRDYRNTLKLLESLLLRFDTFDHPLLETMKQSAIEELSTVHAAIQCEIHVGQYDFTRSMVALHKLKVQLRSWSDHIDAVSDYPMFEEPAEEPLLLPDSDDNNEAGLSESVYSSASFSNHSTSSLLRSQFAGPTSVNDSYSSALPPLAGSLLSGSGILPPTSRYANIVETSYDTSDETSMLEKHPSVMSVESNAISPVSEAPSGTLTRLLSQSNILRRGGLLSAALPIPFHNGVAKGLFQKPGDPYVGSSGANSVPSNTLEQVILGGSAADGAANAAGNSGGSGGQGGRVMNGANTLAAEMIALSVKKQERDDGFALPVYQWSRRFFRSLLAKFTLYFYQWLDPFERTNGDYLSLDLTRFVRTPLGISYLQLMDVLIQRQTQRSGDGVKLRVMLMLETQELEDKGAHYYQNGYLCPSSSRTQTELAEASARELAAETSSADEMDASSQHELFMQVHREQSEEAEDFSELWGLRSWPAVFCYPDRAPPLEHWPNIVSLIMDNRAAIDSYRPAFVHSERKTKSAYFITRVDEAMYLVLLMEGGRRLNDKIAQDFMQSVTENLQHSGVFEPRLVPPPASTISS